MDEDIAEANKRKDINQKNIAATDADLEMIGSRLELNKEAHHLQTRRTDREKLQIILNQDFAGVTKRLRPQANRGRGHTTGAV